MKPCVSTPGGCSRKELAKRSCGISWYTVFMYNWSIDEQAFGADAQAKALWILKQTINFGLNGTKLSERDLRRHFAEIADAIDPARRRYLSYLLYDRLDPH